MSLSRLNTEMTFRHPGPVNLHPLAPTATAKALPGARRWGFGLGFAAILAALLLPDSLLAHFGLASSDTGGNVLTKFYPYAYLAILGGGITLFGDRRDGGLTRLIHDSPGLIWSIVLLVLCTVHSVLSIGISGIGVYVNTYLAAMLLAVAIAGGTPRQCRMLGYTLMAFALVNIVISLLEGATQTHFLPLEPGLQQNYDLGIDEFRGQGLYDHPLNGAYATALALFLLLGMKLRGWVAATLFGFLVLGLLSFGGRTALAVSMLVVVLAALGRLAISLVRRRLSLRFLAAVTTGVLLLPPLFVVVISFTDVGARIMSHLYMDNSADVRVIQWRILDLLNLKQTLFGVPAAQVAAMKAQIGLAKPGTDIESFPLLMFLSLGLVGFPFYLISLLLFVLHLGSRTKSSIGWLMMLAAMLICSASNSLGRKVPDLVFLVAFATGLRGFSLEEPASVAAVPRPLTQPPSPRARSALSPSVPARRRALAER